MSLPYQILILLSLSLVLSLFSGGRRILFPLQIFTTWIHECAHALAAALLGGSSIRITLATDGSGLTQFKIPPGRLRQGLIASAGYLGASAAGCIIFTLTVTAGTRVQPWSPQTLALALSALIGLTLLFWMRNAFGFLSVAILGGALAALPYSPLARFAQPVLLFLGIQTAFNALFDIRILFSLSGNRNSASDAHTMQKLFYLPSWCWALAWMGISLFMMAWAAQRLR